VIGLSEARREGRPGGLCVAGIVISVVWLALMLIVWVVLVAVGSV